MLFGISDIKPDASYLNINELKDLRAAAEDFSEFPFMKHFTTQTSPPQTLKYQRPKTLHERLLSVHQQRLLQQFKSRDPNPHVH